MTAWATIIVGILGLVFTAMQYRRANYERVERLLDYATSGDLAQARHRLGSESWIREPGTAIPLPATSTEANLLTEALFRVSWAFDRIRAVRATVRFGPRRLIDVVLGDWVRWWGEDQGGGCRFGHVAAALQALDPEEHRHLFQLIEALGGVPCRVGHGSYQSDPSRAR